MRTCPRGEFYANPITFSTPCHRDPHCHAVDTGYAYEIIPEEGVNLRRNT